ncbi:MAG: serine/threonine protein kinase, partial [Planctomycetota bacterium]|nr:serine/threonine protein kinase [Planctomycetota bacterium]
MVDSDYDDAYHLAGDRLGKFVILDELGRGSMGVVYEAFQEDLKRKVAIKILPANIALDAKQVRRFRREAESMARLQHEHIIPIYEVGEIDATHYFAMEKVEGQALGDRSFRDKDSMREAARLAMQAARGLAHAHDQGVIHRDVKPGNLLVARDGRVVVSDFGLARLTDSVSLTSTDAIVGTPKYMAPEQILPGRDPLDGRADIYSLGATLYEVVAGRPPFEEPSVQAFIKAILEDRPVSPRKFNRQVPIDLATIILRCLEKNPNDRYERAADLADDLDRFLKGERIHAK